jgi:Acetoacetate decarboxylase (ADC)
MLKDGPELKPQYRMPRVFGALPGPRNVPVDKQQLPNRQKNLVISVTALTHAALLSELLPPECVLDGEPLLTVSLNYMRNIGWLAGRDYAILSVVFRMAHESPTRGLLRGNFMPVLWENLAEPILTGREELGWSKLYADLPLVQSLAGRYCGQALWQGFKFLEIEAGELQPTSLNLPVATGNFHYKYFPRTGALDQAELDCLQFAAPGENVAGYDQLPLVRRMSGVGSFRFHATRWEEMPFQYPIINALARLPLLEPRGATVSWFEASGVIGDSGAGALRPVR